VSEAGTMSNSVTFIVLAILFAVPLTPQARVILFDVVALWICIAQRRVVFSSKQMRLLLMLFGVYVMIMLISTFVHGLPLVNFLRRTYVVALLVMEAIAVCRLFSDSSEIRQVCILLGSMIGMSMHYFYPTDDRVKDLPIKFLLGIPLGVIVALLPGLIRINDVTRKIVLSAGLFAYSIYCIFAGSRMNGGIFFLTSVLVWIKFEVARESRYRKVFFLYLLFSPLVAYSLIQAYTILAIKGYFGAKAQGIAVFQSQFFGSILLGGRPEIIVNMVAFINHPLLGMGPISTNPEYLNLLGAIGVYSDDIVYGNKESVYHSMLFGAAHEGGILAILMWIYLIYKILYALPTVISRKSRMAMAVVPLLLGGVWNILFSPLIAYNRWIVSIALGAALFEFSLRSTRRSGQVTQPPQASAPRLRRIDSHLDLARSFCQSAVPSDDRGVSIQMISRSSFTTGFDHSIREPVCRRSIGH
jgi:hypothetical protein